MAAKVSEVFEWQATGSPVKDMVVTITGDASYPTGGYPLGTAQGLPASGTIVYVGVEVAAGATQMWGAQYDYVNQKLKITRDAGEVAAATNLSTLTVRALVKYKVA